ATPCATSGGPTTPSGENGELLELAARRADRLAVPHVGARPRKRLAVVTCMDARIDPLRMFGLRRGDAHVLRNAGGLVTDDVVRSLHVSQTALGTDRIVVVMHEGCGLKVAPGEASPEALDLGAFDDLERTLRDGVERLRTSPLIQASEITGCVFDPETGAVRAVA
ncbi:MAG: carbonic anhydrase, partial [Acidobacteriota bacterium]|nr:carbonic anhydrase [Acidobacteriota bacterium]